MGLRQVSARVLARLGAAGTAVVLVAGAVGCYAALAAATLNGFSFNTVLHFPGKALDAVVSVELGHSGGSTGGYNASSTARTPEPAAFVVIAAGTKTARAQIASTRSTYHTTHAPSVFSAWTTRAPGGKGTAQNSRDMPRISPRLSSRLT
jgi:hypothetical protein